jgi:hypothetical protein
MKAKTILLALCAILFANLGKASSSISENIGGAWFGYITQSPTGLADRYIFQLYIDEVDGAIQGQSYIALEDEDAYGIMDIKCEIEDGKLNVTELEIIDQQLFEFAYWCVKSYKLELKVENGISILEGDWESDYCGDSVGSIHLERRLS